MRGRRRLALVAAGLGAAGSLTLPAAAFGGGAPAAEAELGRAASADQGVAPLADGAGPGTANAAAHRGVKGAHLSLRVHGVHHGKVRVGGRARMVGYLRPFVPDQHVEVSLIRHGHVISKVNPKSRKVRGKKKGRFRFKTPPLVRPATYRVLARHLHTRQQAKAVVRSHRFHVRFPDLDPGDRRGAVKILNRLLVRNGYYSTHGRRYGAKTSYALMAFRKVNGMKRTYNANPQIFKKLADGKGRFHLRYPGAGRHVEVDISRQVMVLADHGKAQSTFHVSTGAPATPTIRGHYRFYSRQPGFNAEGMYYSVYWHGGYAIHGYHSVPPYNASHGCIRNPIPESKFIYDWVRLGMSIYTYG